MPNRSNFHAGRFLARTPREREGSRQRLLFRPPQTRPHPDASGSGRSPNHKLIASRLSKCGENLFASHTLVLGNLAEDRIQCADSHGPMIRHDDSLPRRIIGLQGDVAALLVHLPISPLSTKRRRQRQPTDVPWQFHDLQMSSSSTGTPRRFAASRTATRASVFTAAASHDG